MLFHVQMSVSLPHDMPVADAEKLKSVEREKAQELQSNGKWRHLWRVAGRYANISIFDVSGPSELHDVLTGLPLFPFMRIEITPICRHPSSVHKDDQ